MKKIFVFIKDVPNTDKIQIDYEKGVLKRETAKTIINPPDESAIYCALRLKKELNYTITALCMGPAQSSPKLEFLLALGFDNAYLISGLHFGGSDTLATANVLSQAAIKIGKADLYFFGSHSLDGDTGQVPGEFCELMNIPSISNAVNFSIINNLIRVAQDLDEKREIECPFPAGVSFLENRKLKIPLPCASAFFQKKQIFLLNEKDLNINLNEIGINGSPTKVMKVWTPLNIRKPKTQPYSLNWVHQVIDEVCFQTKNLTL